VALADQLRAAAAQVDADRGDRLAAERDEALLRALAPGAQEALAQVDVGDLEPDRLRGAQPARVHHLEQGAVAEHGRLVAARRGEQLLDLGVVEDLGQLLGAAGRGQHRGRVVGDQLVAAQVLVEGAQAGGLAVDRRGRAGTVALVARRQVGEELGDVRGAHGERVHLVGGEELAVLVQVGPVGVQRVAREAALELQIGEEVEDQSREPPAGVRASRHRRLRRLDCDRHVGTFSRSGRIPCRATRRPLNGLSRGGAQGGARRQRRREEQRVLVDPATHRPGRQSRSRWR
jgi:hypothetical protein